MPADLLHPDSDLGKDACFSRGSLLYRDAGLSQVRFVPLSGNRIPAPGMRVWNPRQMAPGLERFVNCARAHLAAGVAG